MATKRMKLQKGKSLIPLFSMDVDGKTLIINRDYVRGLYPFKDILSSDNTKDKNQAYKIFMYIYLMNDYNSELDGLPYEEKHNKAIVLADINTIEMPNFEKTKVLKDATNHYLTIYEALNPQIKLYRTLRRSLHTAERTIQTLSNRLESSLNNIEKRQRALEAKQDSTTEDLLIDISPVISDLNSLMSLSKSLPDTINSINNIFDSIKEEELEDTIVRGGGNVGDREDPSYRDRFTHKKSNHAE